MTANPAYTAATGLQHEGPHRDFDERSRGKRDDERRGAAEGCGESVKARSSIQGVNTLRRSPLFAPLGGDDIARLSARCLWRRVLAGEYLVDEPADGCALSIVTNGRVRAVQMMNGREAILRDIEEGDWFGSLSAIDSGQGSTQIVAVTDAILARMPTPIFRDAVHRFPQFCDQVLTGLAAQIRSMNNRFSEQISLTTRERLCVELLRLCRRTATDRIAVSPPPSHEELGNRIGGLRETVTRLLIALEREGLISRSRSAIALLDLPRLREIAAPGNGAA